MTDPRFVFPDWPAPARVRAAVTMRRGGVSSGPWASFNLGDHVGDAPAAVRENRRLLRERLRLPAEPVWLDQRHGRTVVRADASTGAPVGDAAVAFAPGQVCAVLTADCLPILACDTAGTRVAVIHAGWRGLAGGVIEAGVAALEADSETLIAWLGPAIGAAAYEIDQPVVERLLADDPEGGTALTPTRPGHWRADLYALARRRLSRLGVASVHGGDRCTYTEPERFFSHRRQGRCGRMASLIWLEDPVDAA